MAHENLAEIWPTDPYSLRSIELYLQLMGKDYISDPEAIAETRAHIDSMDLGDDIDDLKSAVLASEAGFLSYHQSRCRRKEVEAILAAEGLTPPTLEEYYQDR